MNVLVMMVVEGVAMREVVGTCLVVAAAGELAMEHRVEKHSSSKAFLSQKKLEASGAEDP